MIRVYRSGRHSHRTPLSYGALTPLYADAITQVGTPAAADLYVFAHVNDIVDAPRDMVRDWRRRRRPIVLMSEEPFWDTIWTRQPMNRHIMVDTRFGRLPVIQLTHYTSPIFKIRHIPYYLLTHPRFEAAYRTRFAQNAQRRPAEWLAAWQNAPMARSFMFERRPEPYHDCIWPAVHILGLCAWRTALAEACDDPGTERLGHSWQGGARRQTLPDWHADKLAQLSGRARQIGAIENTHQPNYITEKLFDAFACGGLPLYVASPAHHVHRLGLAPDSWINLVDLTPDAAAARCRAAPADDNVAAAYSASQATLADLFGTAAHWQAARAHLQQAVIAELEAALG